MDFFASALELKTVNTAQRIISGWAAYHHNTDRVGDIIDPAASAKAVARLTAPSDVAVFIGHDASALPVGIPQKIEAHPQGLYTETYVLKGPAGDNLLAVAKDLQAHGLPLGLSIGYRTHDSRHERAGTKRVRRLLDYSLKEFSFASHHVIANPLATMTDVKSRRARALSEGSDTGGGTLVPPDRKGGGMQCRVDQRGQQWVVLVDTDGDGDADDNRVIGTYDDENTANLVAAALRTMASGGDDDADAPMKTVFAATSAGVYTGPPAQERKAVWSTAMVNALDDSCFLYVESGGTKDEENKTEPRGKRHFPFKDGSGKVDLPSLRKAIAQIPHGAAPGLDDAKKAALQARARRMLDAAEGGKTAEEPEEWKTGAPIQILALSYRLRDLAAQVAEECKSMQFLGEDIKGFSRVRKGVRDDLKLAELELHRLIDWADTIERGEDNAATIARYRAAAAVFDF